MRIRPALAALLLTLPATLSLATPAVAAACSGTSDFDGDGVDDVAVGDPFGNGQRGAVHVLSGDKVVPVAGPDLAAGDAFGWSVALTRVNGDACADLVVGAPYTDVNGVTDAGAVYVLYGGGTAPPQRLTAPEPQRDAHFGWSLAARGDLLAIGAPYEDEAQLADAGSVYVRKGDGRLRRISQDSADVPGNGEVGDQFGWSLALAEGNGLVVGVPYENDDGAGRQVGVGKVDSGSITLIRDVLAPRLTAVKADSPSRSGGDRYGYAVAYANGTVAASAPGAGYVQLLDQNLRPGRTIRPDAKEAFGFSLATSSDGRLAIGSPYGGGVRVVSLRNPDDDRKLPSGEGLFGWSVAFGGNRLYVGQPDAPPYGRVSSAGRNAGDLRPLAPPQGADFGAALAGGS
ncbi:hypothetical protein ABT294_20610 [Nonomuraea sp. NPDC000554]|uniref:hypothetical protein n=1 Tax=Nonomuraea sp. NPDC000554 TaxID=3154259 RepID=UPI003329C571